jgi:hypothetical protein
LDQSVFDGMVGLAALLSRSVAQLAVRIDEVLLDGVVKAFGFVGRLFSVVLGLLDGSVVDGVVKGIADLFGAVGRWTRRMQTGHLPDYLWNAFMIILLLVALLVMFQRI